MSEYGYQCFDSNGVLKWDHTAIFSRILGSYDIDWFKATYTTGDRYYIVWESTITDIDFSGGTPYCSILPLPPNPNMAGHWFNQFPPDITIENNVIRMKYYALHGLFPDDLGTDFWWGGVKVIYGVYTS